MAHDTTTAPQQGFAFIGKILALKPQNFHQVRAILFSAWSFAAPLSIEVLDQNKYLFIVSHENHYKNIINQGPWNVRSSLLLLQPRSPALSIEEIKLNLCAFWIQVHDLPLQYMTTQNAIRIGKGIGKILQLDNDNSTELVCRRFIRFKIEIDTSLPLALGFNMSCDGEDTCWTSFLYERLDDYCSSCGLIDHKSGFCPSPTSSIPPDKYKRSLRAPLYGSTRLISKMQTEDSDLGISLAAFVGNSPSSVVPSQMLEPYGSMYGQLLS